VYDLLGFAAKLHAIDRDLKEVGPAIVAKACEMVAAEAKRVLGTHDLDWPELRPETIARKMRGDSPLLETGAMRDSITWNSKGLEGHVGSNLDRAVWMELGTARVPPRPFLASAAQRIEKKIHRMAAKAVHSVLRGEGLNSAAMRELIHLLKHVARQTKEIANDLTGDDKGKKRR
jgi:phage gpG-like protein